ncbi:carbamoyltransferase C-terminal domain-containing protein [Kribbella monticola]|uniref:carbamoyltransferase C-terminal domain-containing protein n=1 Tax=Kribbella monticola TaxID=2185285 RepID=UPI000DD482EE|nr:carbamoyltransferase C-terminal domain-containing protein [Kribbella monticola]
MTDRYVLGVSMSSHDRAAALMKDGEIVSAIAEERIDRRKKSQGFYGDQSKGIVLPPLAAINYVLRAEGISLDDVSLVVCGRSVTTCRSELLTYLAVDPDKVVEPPVPSHHLAHAYSAYAVAPFDECDILVLDEQGHRLSDGTSESSTCFRADGSGYLSLVKAFPAGGDRISLGMYFDVFSALTGLSEAGLPAAGKLMALAAYGTPRTDWAPTIRCEPDGGFLASLAAVDELLAAVSFPVRPGYREFRPETIDDLRLKYAPIHWSSGLSADLARHAQDGLETAVLHVASSLRAATGHRFLTYAGGVALNCTANARLLESGYQDVFVQPAATDDGSAIGLAAYGWYVAMGQEWRSRQAKRFSPRLGKRYSARDTASVFEAAGLSGHARPTDVGEVARRIGAGEVVCWFEGRSEWGPRALGGRSILTDATAPGSVLRVNGSVKHRERFRPVGLSLDGDYAQEALELDGLPQALGYYMLSVAKVRDERLRGVCHQDGSVRYQLVAADEGIYSELLAEVKEVVGVPAVINTSFNTGGEPLVETPLDAVRQFLMCGADSLYLDGYLIVGDSIDPAARAAALRACGYTGQDRVLGRALQHEAAGYEEVAREIAAELPDDLSRGPDHLRERAGLLLRSAVNDGDLAAATVLFEEVWKWSAMPAVASSATRLLSERGATIPGVHPHALRLLAAMSAGNNALPTVKQLFGGRGEVEGSDDVDED